MSATCNHINKQKNVPWFFRAEQLASAQNPDKENSSKSRGGSFFKKRTARRAKSLGKDHWDDVIFCVYALYYLPLKFHKHAMFK